MNLYVVFFVTVGIKEEPFGFKLPNGSSFIGFFKFFFSKGIRRQTIHPFCVLCLLEGGPSQPNAVCRQLLRGELL